MIRNPSRPQHPLHIAGERRQTQGDKTVKRPSRPGVMLAAAARTASAGATALSPRRRERPARILPHRRHCPSSSPNLRPSRMPHGRRHDRDRDLARHRHAARREVGLRWSGSSSASSQRPKARRSSARAGIRYRRPVMTTSSPTPRPVELMRDLRRATPRVNRRIVFARAMKR